MNDLTLLPSWTAEELAALGPSELIDLLIENEDRVPLNVIEECARRNEDMSAHLRKLHEDNFLWQQDASGGAWWLRLHAVMILGLIPAESAGLLLVELMRRMSQENDDDLQDWLSGYWPALFRNKPDAVIHPLRALAEDQRIDVYMRTNAFDPVIAAASRQGGEPLEQALAWLAAIAANEDDDWECRLDAAGLLLHFPRCQYRPLLEDLEARDSGWGKYFDKREIEQAYAGLPHLPQWERFDNPWDFYEPDAIAKHQKRWQEEAATAAQSSREGDSNYSFDPYAPSYDHEPYVRPEPKVGRNDPCPCGSGKKYKQCCLKAQQEPPQDELLWRRIRRAIEGSPEQMLKFADSHYGPEALLEAWDDFMYLNDEPFTIDTPHMPVFMPWFYYEWTPDPDDTIVKREALDGRTLGRAYLNKKGRHLDPLLARYIEQCCVSPFSFYDILSVRPGEGFVARDIFTGEEINITEHSASRHLQKGDILFGKVVRIDHVAMLEACAPALIPPAWKGQILELRREMEQGNHPVTQQTLWKYRDDILDLYIDAMDRLFNPSLPQLQNTDGDPLVNHKLYYEIDSPRAAFDALSPLCLTPGREQLLAEAEYDNAGNLRAVEFSWHKKGNEKHKSWDNTVLGNIRINGSGMTIEVNSENRAQKIRTLVEDMLPNARYKTTTIESMQSMLERRVKEGGSILTPEQQKAVDELNSRPELQAMLAEQLRQHFSTWPETSLPALNGQTPLQAVKTRDGREMVEALLTDIERRGQLGAPPLDPAIIPELRERLGLV